MGTLYDAGQNLRKNAQALDFGQIASDAAHQAVSRAVSTVLPPVNMVRAMLPGVHDFVSGLTGGSAPVANAVTVALPAAKPPKTDSGLAARAAKFHDAMMSVPVRPSGGGSGVVALASGKAASTSNNPFEQTIARFAKENGGISLNELAALSDSAYKTSVLRTQPKQQSTKDLVGLDLRGMADEMFAAKMQQAQAAKATDPALATKLQGEAVKERMETLKAILGANPVDLQTAAAMVPGEAR